VSPHPVQWVTAEPLWSSLLSVEPVGTRHTEMRKPALLRFERDSFMDDLAGQLASDPHGLSKLIATPITYRLPAPGESEPPKPSQDDLKLYQAVHGHFYLVAATLSCQLPGLPEHEVKIAARERVSFVLRRLQDGGTGEWAWVTDPSPTGSKSWKLLDDGVAEQLDPDEQQLPLFPVRYSDGERPRRLFVGLVPTNSGEAFKAAGTLSPLAPAGSGSGGVPDDPRPAALSAKVTDPLRALIASPASAAAADASPADEGAIEQAAADQQVEASRFLLLDFAEFLNVNFGWFETYPASAPDGEIELALWEVLSNYPALAGGGISWRDALDTAWHERLVISGDQPGSSSLNLNLRTPGLSPDAIDAAVAAALGQLVAPDDDEAVSIQGDIADPPAVPKLDASSSSRYVLRCVYRRPACGPLQPDVVSEPTDAFRIAGFFDFDAPSRSITISMPINTSIKDLRKLRKNVNFMLSNQLRAQMNRVTSLKDALNGQFAAGEDVDLGLICSFSIPVITICALIVLMIFISLLNIVFWWMPFLRICFPIALSGGDD
jgi:hypothetical protein